MDNQLRKREEDHSQPSDWSARHARQNSGKIRVLKAHFTKFELQIITIIYYEGCTIEECAMLLEVSVKAIKITVWRISEKILNK